MRVAVLGDTRIAGPDGAWRAVGGPGVRALLALLAMDAGVPVAPERLIDLLYGPDAPGNAVAALQSQVSRLRREVKPLGGDVEFGPAGYRLTVPPEHVDAVEFDALAVRGRAALASGDDVTAARLLGEALELWRGPALADVGDARFAAGRAARLADRRLGAECDRVEAWLRLGRYTDAADRMRDVTAEHPLHERSWGLLIRALHGGGRTADALTAYRELRTNLAERLGSDPSPALVDLHRAVLRGELPSGAETPVNRTGLPAQLTSFVGRDAELETVSSMLERERLVTLTGPGGTGKTRLAIEAVNRYPRDSCFVDLTPLTEPEQLPVAVIQALGVRDTFSLRNGPRWDPSEATMALSAALADRDLLLVLDNAEHVVEAVADLVNRLLTGLPRLRVLVTSREALAVTGETLCPVPGLEMPPPGADVTVAGESGTVRLFAERAAAVSPGFRITPDNLDPVVRICRALDGLPLAIELAAARTRSMSPADIVRRLGEERFGLLSRGSRTAAPRHQTLRAVVAWSWDLLEEPERRLARRFTVFSGGADVAAVSAVCDESEPEAWDLLTTLVDKSFLEHHDGRYRMLETIHRFCAERLEAAGEAGRFRDRHVAYFLGLAEEADPLLRGRDQLRWAERLRRESGNLGAAIATVTATRDAARSLRLVSALTWYWWTTGQRGQGATYCRRLLRWLPVGSPPGLRDEYLLCLLNALALEAPDPALQSHVAGVGPVIDIEAGVWPGNPVVMVMWSMLVGPPQGVAVDDLGRRLTVYQEAGADSWALAVTHLGMAYACMYGGSLDEAEREFDIARAEFEAVGDRWGHGNALAGLATVAARRGAVDRFRELIDGAVRLMEQMGAVEERAELSCDVAELLLRTGEYPAAAELFGEAERLTRDHASVEGRVRAKRGLGEIARVSGDLDAAERLLGEALDASLEGWFFTGLARANVLVAWGRTALDRGDPVVARSRHRRAWRLMADRRVDQPGLADVVLGVAACDLAEDRPRRAAALLAVAGRLHSMPETRDVERERLEQRVRAALSPEEFEAATARGRDLDQAELDEWITADG
ncbi:putative ATPase [Stackebrandtia albiflava]|uniref:Putative ATPase n=1 Tax=Stackebrandtia albiflava TaxID=406432 RepID=A0A562V1V1_9ACTN|nr:BTAD domain-containing putative transcriptional regulator [Stackebrandtia albiflava]TWJ11831.1 putative ATPase [Stackebrandtia albiflava]